MIPQSMEWFYVTSVAVTKFALLLLYLRIFAVGTHFRLAIYVVATSVALWAIALYIVLVRVSCFHYFPALESAVSLGQPAVNELEHEHNICLPAGFPFFR